MYPRPILLLPLALLLLLAGCGAPSELGARDRQRVAGHTFVVTGASSGFGRGVAVKLGRYGGNLVLAARRAAVLEEVAAEIRAGGGEALAVPTDVSDAAQVERLAELAVARFGRIDAWINNAGVAALGRFEEVPLADHARVIDVNLKGTIHGSHAALRQFRRQGHGTLVNVGSVESRVPLAYHASYAASKHAVLGLGHALRQELRLGGAEGIGVSTVMPWAVDTPFWQHTANYTGGTPRMILMDGPEKVVDAIIWAALHPRREVAVGWKAEGALLGHQLMPALSERIAGNIVHRQQMELAPPAPPTAGALYEPVPAGTGVVGEARARMRREDAAREEGAREGR